MGKNRDHLVVEDEMKWRHELYARFTGMCRRDRDRSRERDGDRDKDRGRDRDRDRPRDRDRDRERERSSRKRDRDRYCVFSSYDVASFCIIPNSTESR